MWRKHLTFWIALALAITVKAAAAEQQEKFYWQRLADMPQGVVDPSAAISGSQLVVSGGLNLGGGAVDLVQIMDLNQLQWTRTLHLHQPRYNHGQVTLDDGRILVAGGWMRQVEGGYRALDSCELIDPVACTVSAAAGLPEHISSPTLHLLDDGRVVAVGAKIVTVYDPQQNTWSEPITMMRHRISHRSLLIGPRRVLVIGGTGMQTLEVIDLEKMQAIYYDQPRLPFTLDDMTCWLIDDTCVWVIGGQSMDGRTVDQTWLIRLRDGQPGLVEDGPRLGLEGGVADHVLIPTQHGLVLAGGEAQADLSNNDTELSIALLLDPATLSVRRLPDLSVAHDDAAAVAWQGRIIVLGGEAPGSLLGLAVPTPVRAVEMLEEGSGIGYRDSGIGKSRESDGP
ncbi:MAG: hypothetical protein IT445_11525 [Phycisphaeraceae bacterium]|nr:hypothetical protein [Phycisphaeraceae bacterium]